MRYVPNLIPQKSKVLPNYFKGNIYTSSKMNPFTNTILWIFGVFFLIIALSYLKHPILFLMFGVLGFVLIPQGHSFIERKLKFRITNKIKTITTITLLISSLPLVSHYFEVDKQEVYHQKLIEEKNAKEKAITDENDRKRKDSLKFYLNRSYELTRLHKIENANKQLKLAMAFANSSIEKEQIRKAEIGLSAVTVKDLVKAGKYQIALSEINKILSIEPSNYDLQIIKALCFSKTGKIQEAVNQLKPLIQLGNLEADKLHNQINPIRKRITGYHSQCCDGSISYSRGRGTCSHHGGVCNWNVPEYEEYRKYK